MMAMALVCASALAQANLTTPVGTVNEQVGTKSTVHTAIVTVTTAGTLSAINVLTEGVNNKDFQLSSYSCNPNTNLTLGQVCTIGYTFQPQFAGLRRGGITLNDSNGNPLGIAYIAGFGTGPQVAAYGASGGAASPQLVVGANVGGQIAVDGAGNIYYITTGSPKLYKATPNPDGSYTSAVIASPGGLGAYFGYALAVDGLGNVYYSDLVNDRNSQTGEDCAIGKLTPGASGYTASDPIVFGSTIAPICPGLLAVDGAGTIYYADGDQINLGYETFNAGSYLNTTVGQLPDRNASDLNVDPEHNVYWADCGGPGYPYRNNDEIYPWNPSTGKYGAGVDGGYSFTYNGGSYGNQANYFGYQCGIAPSSSGGYWMSDLSQQSSGSILLSAIYYFTPTNGTFNYTAQQFSAPINALPASIRTDAQGNLYFRSQSAPNLGIYKISVAPSITYPATNAGSQSAVQDLVVMNFGTLALNATGNGYTLPSFISEVSGGSTNGLSDCSTAFSLQPATFCALDTAFNAGVDAVGPVSGNIAVFTNSDNTTTTTTIPVQATAVQPPPAVTSISPSSGSSLGGTTVILSGTALGNVSAVKFNATPAQSISLISETQMQVVAPAGTAGAAATLTLTGMGGTTTTGSALWTWNQIPSTTVSTLHLAQNSLALNGATTITATMLTGSGVAIPNQLVTFHSSNPGVVAAPAPMMTNASGVVTATLTGLTLGSTTFTATTDNETLSNAPTLTVTSGVAVGSTDTGLTAGVTITKAGTLQSVQLLDQGANDGERVFTSSDCVMGSSPSVGHICNITFSFTPLAPGLRQGAIVLLGSDGSVLGETLISGTGVGPLGVFSVGTASLQEPYSGEWESLALDGAGNLYAADANLYQGDAGERIWKITPSGTKTTLTQDANGGLMGIALDGAGNLFYGDSFANKIFEMPGGTGTAVAIASVTNPGTNMTTDGQGNLYVGSSKQVIQINAVTHATTVVGSVAGTVGGVALDTNGNIFYTDSTNNKIYETPQGGTTGTVISTGVTNPAGIAVDAGGDLYVGSLSQTTLYRLVAGSYAVSTVSFFSPAVTPSLWAFGGVILDRSGNIYTAIPYTNNQHASGFSIKIARNAANPVAFSTIPAGSTSAASLVPFENDGNNSMMIMNYGTSSQFSLASVTNGCAIGQLAVGQACEMGLVFAPTVSGAATGTANITDSLNDNYSVALSGTATSVSQTITFPPPPSSATPGTQVTLGATASSGLPVTYTVKGPATLSGSTLSYTGGGTVVITASQPGNGGYTAATPVQASVLVSQTNNMGTAGLTDTVTIAITASGTLQQPLVLTQGAPNLDFQLAAGGTCTVTTAYTAGQSCTVNYTFAPIAPGARLGAILLEDAGGNVLGASYVTGTGNSPQALFTNGISTTVASRLSNARSVSFDGAGDIFVTQDGGSVERFAAGTAADTHLTSVGFTTAGTAIDGAGNLYFGEENTGLLEMTNAGAGEPTQIASGWNPDNTLLADGSGNLYSSDINTGAIMKIAVGTHAVTTILAGGQNHRFIGLAIDASGNLYAADYTNSAMYEVVAGSGTATLLFSGNGLSSPQGLAIDAAGNFYVTNTNSSGNVQRYAAGTYAHTVLPTGFASVGIAIDASGSLLTLDGTNLKRYTRTSTPALNFNTVPVGSTTAAQTVGLENDGNLPLTISSIAGSTDFSLDATTTTCSTSTPLAVAGTCAVGATFTSNTQGTFSEVLSITDNTRNVAGTVQQIPASVVVTGMPQTITFQPPVTTFVNGSAPITLTATGGNSGNPVTFSIVSGPGAVSGVNGATLNFNGAGSIVVQADQAASGQYIAATPVRQTFTITAAPSTYSVPASSVGSTSATQTATVTLTASGTIGTAGIHVLTQGASNLDFQFASGGSCAMGTAHTAGYACTVEYTFAPAVPGARLGAIVLKDDAGNILGTSYVHGVGNAPEGLFTTGISANVASLLDDVRGISIDAAGNIYASEQSDGNIDKFAAGTGVETTIAQVLSPAGTTVDGAGNVYVASAAYNQIYELVGGTGTLVSIASGWVPDNVLVVDGAGNVYSPDASTGAIHKIAAGTHQVTTALPSGSISRIIGMTIDASGNLYAADFTNNAVYEIVAGSGTATLLFSGAGLSNPHGLAIDAAGNFYVTNYSGDGNVQRYSAGTYTHTEIPTGYALYGIAIDASGNLLTLDGSNIQRYTRTSTPTLTFSATNVGAATSAQTTSIENDGNAALTISSLATSAADFTLDPSTTCSTTNALPVAGVCNIATTFTPQTQGALTGSVVITDNTLNATSSTQQIALSGTGTGPAISAITPASGPSAGGTVVTITGSGFTGATAVNFGSVAAQSFTVVSDTEVTATAPAATAGAVPITIKVGTTGSPLTTSDVFTYLTASLAVTNQAAAVGSSPTLSATLTFGAGFVPTGAVSFTVGSHAAVTAACVSATSTTETCTATYSTSGLTTGANTITVSLAADTNYTMASNTGTLMVLKITPTITTAPSASDITYGQTLASSTLSGGAGSVDGSFDWTTPTTVPSVGTASYSVTFTPTDTTDYKTITTTATVTVSDTFAGFSVTGVPAHAEPGTAYTVTVTAVGNSGATYTGFTGMVTLSASTPANASFSPGSYNFTGADNGIHQFTVTFSAAGTESVTASSGGVSASEAGIVVGGYIWVVGSNGLLDRVSETGSVLISGVGQQSSTTGQYGGVAFDASGNAWSVVSSSNSLIETSSNGGNATPLTGGGLNAPVAVAVDGSGKVWIANSGNNSVSVFANGTAVSGASGFASSSVTAPSGIAIDSSGGVWTTNSTKGTVTRLFGAAMPVVTPTVSTSANGQSGGQS